MDELRPTDPRHIGTYALIRRLGSGGMGTVFLGKKPNGDLVAIKVIRSEMVDDKTSRDRFKREIELAGKVSSPYVAKVLDYCTNDGEEWWFAAEYVAGVTLAQAMKTSGGTLDMATARRVAHDVSLALEAIHQAGIVHRDLKPQNVMIGHERVMVIDFGIAHDTENDMTSLTATGHVIGTPNYMCPEQIRLQKAVPSWDIFAFGGLMVYATTGHPPFGKPTLSPHDMASAILADERNLSGLPQEFQQLVANCLKPSAERPQASQLHSYLKVQPDMRNMTKVMPPNVTRMIDDIAGHSQVFAVQVQALKPIPINRRDGESNNDWIARNKVYLQEMVAWRRAEKRRKRKARKVERKRHRASVRELRRFHPVVKAMALLPLLAVLYVFSMPDLPGWTQKVKEYADSIDLTPGDPDTTPQLELPGAPFTAAQPSATHDPDMKGSSVQVTEIESGQYQLSLSVTVTGYDGHGEAPFSESCVKVRNGHSGITVHPTSYRLDDRDGNSQTGKIVYSTAFQGTYRLYPECNQDRSIKPALLGTAGKVNQGVMRYNNMVVPVMGSRSNGGQLTVSIIPRDAESSQMCLNDHQRITRPTGIRRVKIGGLTLSEVTFKSEQGKLHLSCSEKNGNVKPHGSGVNVG